jgi:uncharacterized protein (TIGR04255 family)
VEKPTTKLPEFQYPPVIETVLGVQFEPLPKFNISHLGLYWHRIRERYPDSDIQPPLGSVTEAFGSDSKRAPSFGIEFVQAPDVRCWFIAPQKTELIQVQRDRFIVNWRKVAGDEVYPRYSWFKPRFVDEWSRFKQFLHDEGLGDPVVNQAEVTYVNHFDMGKEWKSFGDLPKVLSVWRGEGSQSFLPAPEFVQINNRYELPDQSGRLHVLLQPGIRRRDAKELLQLTLTARGKPKPSDLDGVLKFFDLGHEWIVNGFTDLTTSEMHKLWRKSL